MLKTEDRHPYNQSNNEVLGRVSGGFPLSEDRCECAGCGADLDHGDSVTAYCRVTCPSIHHRWDRPALFCRRCAPSDLDDGRLDEHRRSGNEALVTGTLRDKGYWGHVMRDGERVEEWRYQDNRYAEFAGTRVEDRRRSAGLSPTITDVGGHQYHYSPAEDGPVVPVPAQPLAEVLADATEADTDAAFVRPNGDPVRWLRHLLRVHAEGDQDACTAEEVTA